MKLHTQVGKGGKSSFTLVVTLPSDRVMINSVSCTVKQLNTRMSIQFIKDLASTRT